MPSRILNSGLFRHPKWRSLGSDARLLYLCLIGHPDSNLAGVLPDHPEMWVDLTGLKPDRIKVAVRELIGVGWLLQDSGWVWIPTYSEHQAKSASTLGSILSK